MSHKDPRGYYSVLGLDPSASQDEIKSAYRRRAMEFHPDRNKQQGSTQQFQIIGEAYAVLGDPESRAIYDTEGIETTRREKEAAPLEPVVCSCCGKVTAQPRYLIFYSVKGFLYWTWRTPIQGIFCSHCADLKAIKASAITWVLGWISLYGLIYTPLALFRNLMGGECPFAINARLLLHQALYFASIGKVDIAKAVAVEALEIAKKIKFDDAYAKKRIKLGYEVDDEGERIRENIRALISSLGGQSTSRLRNAWKLLRRSFFVQLAPMLIVCLVLSYNVITAPAHQNKSAQPVTASTLTTQRWRNGAPNGEPWPTSTSYLQGYYQINAEGNSVVVVDNSRSDTPVFVKLIEVGGKTDWTVRYAYISANDSFRMEDLTPGRYELRYRDLKTGAIAKSEIFSLKETPSAEGVRYTEMTVTLYKVLHGNMRTTPISESEF